MNFKKLSKWVSFTLVLTLLITLFAPVGEQVQAGIVKINQKEAIMTVGETLQLKLLNTKKVIKWKSSNTKVATINKSGKVKAVAAGNVKITAKLDGKTYTCTIKINKVIIDPPNLATEIIITKSSKLNPSTTVLALNITNNGDKTLTINSDGYVLNDDSPLYSSNVNLLDDKDSKFSLIESLKIKPGKTATAFYRNEDFDEFWVDSDTTFIFSFTYSKEKFTGYVSSNGLYSVEQGQNFN